MRTRGALMVNGRNNMGKDNGRLVREGQYDNNHIMMTLNNDVTVNIYNVGMCTTRKNWYHMYISVSICFLGTSFTSVALINRVCNSLSASLQCFPKNRQERRGKAKNYCHIKDSMYFFNDHIKGKLEGAPWYPASGETLPPWGNLCDPC